MRENIACRTLIHANPQNGPTRPTDIYDDSQSEDEPMPGSQEPGDAGPGASSMPRTAKSKRPPPQRSSSSGSQNVACDVSYQSDLVRVDNLPVVKVVTQHEVTPRPGVNLQRIG